MKKTDDIRTIGSIWKLEIRNNNQHDAIVMCISAKNLSNGTYKCIILFSGPSWRSVPGTIINTNLKLDWCKLL